MPEEPIESEADRLLREYSAALIHAQTSRLMTDWFEAGQAFNRFLDALMAEGKAFDPAPMQISKAG